MLSANLAEDNLRSIVLIDGVKYGLIVGMAIGLTCQQIVKYWPSPIDENAVLTPQHLSFILGALSSYGCTRTAGGYIWKRLKATLETAPALQSLRVSRNVVEQEDLLEKNTEMATWLTAGISVGTTAMMVYGQNLS